MHGARSELRTHAGLQLVSESLVITTFASSRTSSRILAVSISLLLAPALQAVAADADVVDVVDGVVVTANRIEQPTDRVGDSITVISAEAVRRRQTTSVADLLATTPGVTVARNGGIGGSTSLRIRGAETDQTVVLIDGVKLNDPSSASGGFNFANLLATDYARIEVLRGSHSTLWGSQAIGGVVNIITPVPDGPLSGSFSAEGGTHNTAFVRAHAEASSERFAWRLAGGYLTTDGISAFNHERGGLEDDGYRNVGLQIHSGRHERV